MRLIVAQNNRQLRGLHMVIGANLDAKFGCPTPIRSSSLGKSLKKWGFEPKGLRPNRSLRIYSCRSVVFRQNTIKISLQTSLLQQSLSFMPSSPFPLTVFPYSEWSVISSGWVYRIRHPLVVNERWLLGDGC